MRRAGAPAQGRRDRRVLPWTLVVLSRILRRDGGRTGEGTPARGVVPNRAILGGTVRPEMTIMPGGHMVVALSGEIDIVTASGARDVLAEATSQAVSGMSVDLGDVTFVDAAGLGALVGAARHARHLPDGFRLVAVPARVLRLLKLTGLDRHLAAFPAPPPTCRPEHERAAPLAAITQVPAAAW